MPLARIFMIAVEKNSLHSFLAKHDEKTWTRALENIIPSVHPVDQVATEIWFSFWPLKLSQSLQQSADAAQTAGKMQLDGRYRLEEQIDASVEFLFGSRYWPEIKKTVLRYAGTSADLDSIGLEKLIRDMASSLAAERKISSSVLLGITAVACMILQQVGIAAFAAAAEYPGPALRDSLTAEEVLKARAPETRRGLFSFLRPTDKKFTITFDENKKGYTFQAICAQDLSMAVPWTGETINLKIHVGLKGPSLVNAEVGLAVIAGSGSWAGKINCPKLLNLKRSGLSISAMHPVIGMEKLIHPFA